MHRDLNGFHRLCSGMALALGLALAAGHALAAGNIKTDGTVGAMTTLAGPKYLIPQTLGTLAGNNLFHSFSMFNIGSGETAQFTTSTSSIANVISRVTGNNASLINGTLQLTALNGGAPNFFFINPAGVTFGAGASVNVPGAFHVSTADYLKFPDGNFYADISKTSTFSSAPPQAFGFLGGSRAAVSLNGGATLGTPNAPFQIVAGDVTIDNASVSNQAGDIRVVAVGGVAGEVGLSGVVPAAAGTLSMTNGGALNTANAGISQVGNITVAAGTINMSGVGTGIFSSSYLDTVKDSGAIDVLATQALSIASGSSIKTDTYSTGNAGMVTVRIGSLSIDGKGMFATGIASNADSFYSTGKSGPVQVEVAGSASILNGGQIATTTYWKGDAGPVRVDAGSLTVNGGSSSFATGIFSSRGVTPRDLNSIRGSDGSPGSVQVTVAGQPFTGTLLSPPSASQVGNIATDGSVGAAQVLVPASHEYLIPESLGTLSLSGNNLFQSFSIFNVGPNETATFMTTTPNLANVISRVTGGTASQINGTIQLLDKSGGTRHPDFFFINPAGVTFGHGANGINVPAAFYVSTAQYLKFGDGSKFDATGATTTFSSAAPVAFGFVGNANAAVTIYDGFYFVSPHSPSKRVYQIVAEEVTLDNAYFNSQSDNVRIIASGPGGAGKEIEMSGTSPLASGTLTLSNFTEVITSSATTNSGNITSAAGKINIRGSDFQISAGFTGNAGTFDLWGNERLSLNLGQIIGNVQGTGNAGSVNVSVAGLIAMHNLSKIDAETFAFGSTSGNSGNVSGNGGIVMVNAGSLSIETSSSILTSSSNPYTPGITGNAGTVTVSAGSLSINGGGSISSDTIVRTAGNTGSAGKVTVSAESLSINGGGRISSDTTVYGTGNSGDAGTVTVSAGSLSINGGGRISSDTTVYGTGKSGKAGTVTVEAGTLGVDGAGSGISAAANAGSSGQTGSVIVTATDSVKGIALSNGGSISIANDGTAPPGATVTPTVLSVSAPAISLTGGAKITAATTGNVAAGSVAVNPNPGPAGSVSIQGGSQITSDTSGSGDAGAVTVNATTLDLLSGGRVSSSTSGQGSAGTVTASAGSLTIDGQGGATGSVTGILSQANSGSKGDAGAIEVKVTGQASISNGGVISSSTSAAGKAGAVTVEAGTLIVDGARSGISAAANTGSSGQTGDVTVTVSGGIALSNGASFSIKNDASPDLSVSVPKPSRLSVSAGTLTVDNASITAASSGNVAASGIVVNAADKLQHAVSIVNGGTITSDTTGSGDAGTVTVNAGDLGIQGGGRVSSSTTGQGSAGTVTAKAESLTIDGQGGAPGSVTGILSQANKNQADSTPKVGDAGSVQVSVSGPASLSNGGVISSSTSAAGKAGTVTVEAGTLSVDGAGSGISAAANAGSSGQTGSVIVTATDSVKGIALSNGGSISIANDGTAPPGATVTPTVLSVSAPAISLTGGAKITAATSGNVAAGSVTVNPNSGPNAGPAGSVSVQGGSQITSDTSGAGNAGTVTVNASDLGLLGGGKINSSTTGSGSGNGGTVKVNAGSLTINGDKAPSGSDTGITTNSDSPKGNSGVVTVEVTGQASILNGGVISSAVSQGGNAGTVTVSAGSLTIDGMGAAGFTGIQSKAIAPDAIDAAGAVLVTVTGQASIRNGGEIRTYNAGHGVGGPVTVSAGTLSIDGQGGSVLTGLTSSALAESDGSGGAMDVRVAGQAKVSGGGLITSDTSGPGKAGTVTVAAGNLIVDGRGTISAAAKAGSTGQTGSVIVKATDSVNGIALSNGGSISIANDGKADDPTQVATTTLSVSAPVITLTGGANGGASITAATSGNVAAGSVAVNPVTAGSVSIQGGSQITSDTTGAGNAGTVTVNASSLGLQGSGVISSSTSGAGKAGTLSVNAATLSVDGAGSSINAAAHAGSSGQTGNVSVSASGSISLSNGGTISVANDATVADPKALVPTLLSVSAPTITLTNASITAASTGNVAASGIHVDYGQLLYLDPSYITTSAFAGNGGSIVIVGNGPLILDHSLISTSVTSPTNGNGGDISISAPFMVMNTGFIQANTAAAQASGGNVAILVNSIAPSGGVLIVGGFTPLTFDPSKVDFNAIQAVAPSGLSGNIQVTAPALNISGVLTGLNGHVLNGAAVGKSLCATSGGSSLAQTGRGSLPVSSSDVLSVESQAGDSGAAAPGDRGAAGARALTLAQAQCR